MPIKQSSLLRLSTLSALSAPYLTSSLFVVVAGRCSDGMTLALNDVFFYETMDRVKSETFRRSIC